MKPSPDNIAPIDGRCAVCGVELPEQTVGRRRITCSPAHKQELYRRRRSRRRGTGSAAQQAARAA